MVEDSPQTTGLKSETDGLYFKLMRDDFLGFLRRNPGLFLAMGDTKFLIWKYV